MSDILAGIFAWCVFDTAGIIVVSLIILAIGIALLATQKNNTKLNDNNERVKDTNGYDTGIAFTTIGLIILVVSLFAWWRSNKKSIELSSKTSGSELSA